MSRIESAKSKRESFNSAASSFTHHTPLLQKRRYTTYTSTKTNIKELNSDSFFWRPQTAGQHDKDNQNMDPNTRVYLNGPGPGKYSRGTSVGHLNHDITLRMEPAYTMCKAERFADRHDYSTRDFTASSAYWGRPGTGESTMTRATSAYFTGPGPANYFRASSIGHMNTDLTLSKPPAYTIGRAERIIDLNSNPHLARPKTPRASVTPGPLDYCYEKHSNPYKQNVPAYSIGRAPRFPTIIV